MRETVSKILQVEANRLYEISTREGLTDSNLAFLNKLIDTYEKFVGTAEEEAAPEEQDTAALLKALVPPQETPSAKSEQEIVKDESETIGQ